MARFYNRKRNYYKNSYKKRANGNQYAANAQKDQAKFTVNIPTKISVFNKNVGVQIGFNADTQQPITFNVVNAGTYAINCFDLLRKSYFYEAYASMYDEFKIDKVTIKLTPSSFLISNNQRYSAITVYTAWDRTGLSESQVFTNLWQYEQVQDGVLGHANDQQGIWVNTGNNITTYSSAKSKTLNPNSNTSITRYIYPSTIAEKGQWLSTGSLRRWYGSYDARWGRYLGVPINGGQSSSEKLSVLGLTAGGASIISNAVTNESPAQSSNPCYLTEDPAIKFKPTLLVGVYPKDYLEGFIDYNAQAFDQQTVTANPITFNVEADIVCSFRGLRRNAIVDN